MNPFRRRLTIILASVGAVGAIAAIATAGSLALFYDPPTPVSQTYATGTVSLSNPSVQKSCTVGENIGSQNSGAGAGKVSYIPVAPGYSSSGYPNSLGDQSGSVCDIKFRYTGSMDAFLATDVMVHSSAGTVASDCSPTSCLPLYSPNSSEQNDIEVYPTYNGSHLLGIGGDQTISQPGTGHVDTGYTSSLPSGSSATLASCSGSTGDNCPVQNDYSVDFQIYVYWPLLSSADQNAYQGSNVTITLTLHAVQAYDNSLIACTGINDPENSSSWTYSAPNQPLAGWGGGFNTGGNYPGQGSCPTVDDIASDWVAATPGSTIIPFSHLASLSTSWNLVTNKQA